MNGHLTITDLQKELDNWKLIALYLADCHAATAVDMADRKSGSKSDRDRFASICEKAVSLLEDPTRVGGLHLPRAKYLEYMPKRVVNRCRKGAAQIRERDGKK